MKLKVSIIGGSGYTGGELIRLLLTHPNVEIKQVTSETYKGERITLLNPNLRSFTDIRFSSIEDLENCDLIFLCLPHGKSMKKIEFAMSKAEKIIDLSADFRLKNPDDYKQWYEYEHSKPELLKKFIYGIPEVHRNEIMKSNFVAATGCNATTSILGLYPIIKLGLVDQSMPIILESKCGSSEGGAKVNEGSHHPEREGAVRSYKPTNHRHTAEIVQELKSETFTPQIHFSATAISLIRGILVTSHVFLKENITEKDIWKAYREIYGNEPFIRIVKEKKGIYRYPEPKILAGTNFCDIGFEKDENSNRLVVMSALDNMMKGASGQAIQCMNLMCGFDERESLMFTGLHPI